MESFKTKRILGRLFLVSILLGSMIFVNSANAAVKDAVFTKTLSLRSKGDEVRNLQIFLSQFSEYSFQGKATGNFNGATKRALQKFQKKNNLKPTGKTDAKTRTKLNDIVKNFVSISIASSETNQTSFTDKETPLSPDPPKPESEIKAPESKPSIFPKGKPYFQYEWRASEDLTGEITLKTPAPKPVVVFDGEQITTIPDNAAIRLAKLYQIALVEDEEKWDAFKAGMLLNTLERLPKWPFSDYSEKPKIKWRISLTSTPLNNDFEITGEGRVRMNQSAFTRSNPTLQPKTANNPPRVFFSNRLFQAALRIFYSDKSFILNVIKERYGYIAAYDQLPQVVPEDERDEYQDFSIEELQYIALVLEDLPTGFRSIPGLTHLVRRKDGLTNPFYPSAAAIAWVSRGYMEFMDMAFLGGSDAYTKRLVAHEMTHFLWHKMLREETRDQFMALSGWSKTPGKNAINASLTVAADHPKSSFTIEPETIWYRETSTNFVSDYAAAHNPDEDFAETVSYYLYQPDLVRTVAPEKYEFVKNIVDGYEYVVLVDKQFTFQVFNLEPDLTFPGKIVGTDIEIYKEENGDSRVSATLHLSPKFGDGAEYAYARIVSRTQTYADQYFYPVDGNKFLLRADFVINQYEPTGYWFPEQITVTDRVDNRRYEGQAQFGWLMYIDNFNEDLIPPEADLDRITGKLTKGIPEEKGGYTVTVTIPVNDEHLEGIEGRGILIHYDSKQEEGRSSRYPEGTQEITLEFPIRDYRASGTWTFREFWLSDAAKNEKRYDLKEKALTFDIQTAFQDLAKPTLDVSSIKINAVPKKPEAPDGETDVTIYYRANDDNSGLGLVSYTLLKPNGQILYDYHYHENFYTNYFEGDPEEMKPYKIQLTLPPGSVPGTWILREMHMKDKAGNPLTSNFVEAGILKPFMVK